MRYLLQAVDESEPHWRYRRGHACMPCMPSPCIGADELLRRMKRDAQQLHEEMSAAKKACGNAGDIEGARMFRELASDAMRQYRAVCLVAPWYLDDPIPGDCSKVVSLMDWPVELSSELDRVLGAIDLLPYMTEKVA